MDESLQLIERILDLQDRTYNSEKFAHSLEISRLKGEISELQEIVGIHMKEKKELEQEIQRLNVLLKDFLP